MVAWTVVILYFVANLFAAIFECKPVAAYWDHTIPGAKCVDTVAFYRWNGVANLLIDFMILTLTMPMVWRLSLKLKQKVILTGLFLLGCLVYNLLTDPFDRSVVLASIIRVTTFSSVVATDITYTLVISSMWSTVEQSVGIICACLPVLPALFRRLLGIPMTSLRAKKSSTPSKSGDSFPLRLAQKAKPRHSGGAATDTDTIGGFLRLDEELGGQSAERLAVPMRSEVRTEVGRGDSENRIALPDPTAIRKDQTLEQTYDVGHGG
ncbi:MAG: hypothetical protein Q9191_005304 [Dirinaria sp. TL-2023a]